MTMYSRYAVLACALLVAPLVRSAAQARCTNERLAVQVLGSGGPHAGGSRASSGYLIWSGGRAVALVDAGGGTFARFGEAGARLQDLSLIAISHLHPDHVTDLTALLWLSEQARQQPLKLAGPSGGGSFPAMDVFVGRLFDSTGAFPVLGGTIGRAGQGIRLDVTTVDAAAPEPTRVFADSVIEVTAIGVPHGNVPAIAYRIRVGDRSVVFGSDQNGTRPSFTAFASGADVLVMHLALSQQAPDQIAQLHARPATVGQVARDARAKRLVVSHFILPPPAVRTPEWFSLSALDQSLAEVRKHYAGPVDAAADLQCIPVR